MLGEIAVERKFAFYFVADYEKNQRLWISAGIVILSRLLTLLFTFAIMTGEYVAYHTDDQYTFIYRDLSLYLCHRR